MHFCKRVCVEQGVVQEGRTRGQGSAARARGNTGQERHNHSDSGQEGGLEKAEVGRGPGASGSRQLALVTSTPKSCPRLSSVEGPLP